MSGEEAYQRRLAMSTNSNPASQTTSSTSAPIVTDAAYPVATGSTAPPARAETGEEAYLRRLAMSQGPPPSLTKPVPLQPTPGTVEEAYQQRAALLTQQVSPPPLQNQREPSEPASDSSGYNPFTPQSTLPPPPPSTASADNVNPDFEERVRNSRSAAAAIAARFSALAPAEDKDLSDPAPEESGPGPSARYTP
jgi:splicing factor 45